ncbi:RDD family protein [Fulvivirga sp. M361]|uniref:RDD family protein n=1 Tax=Fulvivirga sp. M361 TaxID=2594266 RepID=UPI001179C432|nr:RDD family protein [Fulvivirga sp. M361]TRX58714.1 RDD family protein [Fulvivirga sp. M361]
MNAIDQFLSTQSKIKVISIIGLYFSAGGILAELLPFIFQNVAFEDARFLFYIKGFLSNLNLGFFTFFQRYVIIFDNGMYINQLNLVVYIIGLIGLALYYFTSEREQRLLRFFLSLIILSNSAGLIIYTIYPLLNFRSLDSNFSWPAYVLFKFVGVLIIYLSYWSLKTLAKDKLDSEKLASEALEEKVIKYNRGEATRWQRIFNLVFDTYMSILILSPFISYFEFMGGLENSLGERYTAYGIILAFRLVYYLFFETLLGMTPAKFLSETRVVSTDFKRPESTKILLRTLSRYVPFDAFSFLGDRGWHDKWSNTAVVKEIRTGVKGGHYFWIFPIAIAIVVGLYFGNEAWEDHQWYLKSKARHERKMERNRNTIEHLSHNTMIELKNTERPYSSDTTYYLKVEDVNGNHVYCSIVPFKKSYSTSKYDIEQYYLQNQYAFNKVEISRTDLMTNSIYEYNQLRSKNDESFAFLNDNSFYKVENIYEAFGPILRTSGGGRLSRNSFEMNIINEGRPCRITSIKNIVQDIRWITTFPLELPTAENDSYPSISLSAENSQKGEPYHFEISIIDNEGTSYRYEVKGQDLEAEFIRLYE